MRNIGIVYCPKKIEKIKILKPFDRIIKNKYRKVFLKYFPLIHEKENIPCLDIQAHFIQFPSTNLIDLSEKGISRCFRKLVSIVNKSDIHSLVLDRSAKNFPDFEKHISSFLQVPIYKGKKLFEFFIQDILKQICKLVKLEVHQLHIGLIVDELCEYEVEIIKNLCRRARFISLVTKHATEMEEVGETIFEETGLLIRIGTNSNEILQHSHIVINLSQCTDFVSTIKIPKQAIVLNGGCEIKTENVKGIVINDIEVTSKNIQIPIMPLLNQLSFLEALHSDCEEDPKVFLNRILKNGYKISGFIGRNGKISFKEFSNKIIKA